MAACGLSRRNMDRVALVQIVARHCLVFDELDNCFLVFLLGIFDPAQSEFRRYLTPADMFDLLRPNLDL